MRARTYRPTDPRPVFPLSCQHEAAPVPHTGASGYAITPDGRTICYPCADAHEREHMATGAVTVAYLSSDGAHVTTWTGGQLARVTAHGVSRYGAWGRSPLHYVTAVTPDGSVWRGRNSGEGMAITMRPAKARA